MTWMVIFGMSKIRTYSELIRIPDFLGRYNYLKLKGYVGKETFGYRRYINQLLYKCDEWKEIRDDIIMRDNGCDLGVPTYDIYKHVIIHHINPITAEDILEHNPVVFDPENLICTCLKTHNAIHYGKPESVFFLDMAIRRPNDTCPWRRR